MNSCRRLGQWVEHSKGKIRGDVAHDKLVVMGFTGSERSSRRAVSALKRQYWLGNARVHRPWVTEPGLWLQYDFGAGLGHRRTQDGVVLRLAGVVQVPDRHALRDHVNGNPKLTS